ncbi:MAG: chalcone isomerase family protein, partial [FCB group bacterium]|nr:chalcone isomerase family protein [FCB group bacterium]
MRTGMVLVLVCAALLGAATDVVKEPSTGVAFPAMLEVGGGKVVCTGVDVRTKYLFKIYAVGHYGDSGAWPEDDGAEELLRYWMNEPVLKAFSLRFTYNVDKDQFRTAWEEGLDKARYNNKALRDALGEVFRIDLPKGDELRFVAHRDGTLFAEHNGKSLGSWKDPELVKA